MAPIRHLGFQTPLRVDAYKGRDVDAIIWTHSVDNLLKISYIVTLGCPDRWRPSCMQAYIFSAGVRFILAQWRLLDAPIRSATLIAQIPVACTKTSAPCLLLKGVLMIVPAVGRVPAMSLHVSWLPIFVRSSVLVKGRTILV